MKPVKQLAAPLLFLLVAAYLLGASVYRPYHNWDMIMYIGAAKSFEEHDAESLRAFTYDQLRASVSQEEYEELVGGSYRYAVSTDPSAFEEQLPFYQVRPLYTGAIYLLYKAGINIGFATHIISAAAVVVALVFLYLMAASFLGRPLIYAIPFLALVFGATDLARYSTPDGMAFLAVILSAYLFLKQRILALFILLPIMLCIRTDLILFTIPLLFFISVFERGVRKRAVLAMVVSIAVYVAIGTYWKNPGWATSFAFTLVQTQTHPLSMPPTLTVSDYLRALFAGSMRLLNSKAFLLYGCVSAYWLYLMIRRAKAKSLAYAFNSSPALLAVVFLIFVIGHFVAFPVAWDRFFSGPYLIGVFSFLVMVTDYLKGSEAANQGTPAHGDPAALHC